MYFVPYFRKIHPKMLSLFGLKQTCKSWKSKVWCVGFADVPLQYFWISNIQTKIFSKAEKHWVRQTQMVDMKETGGKKRHHRFETNITNILACLSLERSPCSLVTCWYNIWSPEGRDTHTHTHARTHLPAPYFDRAGHTLVFTARTQIHLCTSTAHMKLHSYMWQNHSVVGIQSSFQPVDHTCIQSRNTQIPGCG